MSGPDSQEFEFQRETRRVFLCHLDVGIDSEDKGIDDFFAGRMVVAQLFLHVDPEPEQSRAYVTLESFPAQNLGHCSRGEPSPHLQLKEPVPCDVESLSEEKVLLGFSIDVSDSPGVVEDLHRLVQALQQ